MNKRKFSSMGLMFTLFLCFNLVSCGGTKDEPTPAAPLKVFATSVAGTGNLSSWTDAGGNTEIAAGDAVCQARAAAAGLSGTYRAWLSDNTTDAYCHIQGYDGYKVSANCGQTTLPTAAGPWIRTDGNPFADTIDKLINNNQVFTPVRYDENGALIANLYYTGTDIHGTYGGLNCNNWTDGTVGASAGYGSTQGASSGWTGSGGISCSGAIRLLCFQTGVGGPLPSITVPASAKKVFVTSTTHNGNLGGLAGADAICVSRATTAGIANAANFKAWISTGSPSVDAINHLTSNGPWHRLDGVKVADNKAALIASGSTALFTAISQTETGAYISTQYYNVWTGTDDNGVGLVNNCSNWTNGTSGSQGQAGMATISDGDWTNWTSWSCDNLYALYCFED